MSVTKSQAILSGMHIRMEHYYHSVHILHSKAQKCNLKHPTKNTTMMKMFFFFKSQSAPLATHFNFNDFFLK